MHQYEVVGRHKPTERDPKPKVYRMKIFARNPVVARSRFWFFMEMLKRVKKSNGEVLEVHEIFEKNDNYVKNYKVWFRYDSRSGTHNMVKEFRAVRVTDAVNQLYTEMSGKHRVRKSYIQIIEAKVCKASDLVKANTKQFVNSKLSFDLLHRVPRASSKARRATFKVKRPSTIF